jgi:prophage tail gpP-like protein
MPHEVRFTLLDTGTVVDVFDRFDLVLDFTKPGSPWTFSFWRSAETAGEDARELPAERRYTAWETLLTEAKLGGRVLFTIDGTPQLNGRIEDLNLVGNRRGGECLVLGGRDLAGLAMDGHADPRVTLKGHPLDECLRDLFNRVGIQSVVLVAAEAEREVRTRTRRGGRGLAPKPRKHRVDLSHARPNETVWDVAQSIVRKFGLMLWVAPYADAPDGMAVVVDVPSYESDVVFRFIRRERDGVLTPESNVLEREFPRSIRGVPTHVYAAGRAGRGDTQAARHWFDYPNAELERLEAEVALPLAPQPRFLHTKRARDAAHGEQAAAQACADAMKEARLYRATVQGFGQLIDGAMRLYAPNVMAHAYDRTGRRTIVDEEMLVHRVQFSESRQVGQQTHVTLGTKGWIKLDPEAE